MFFRFGSAIVLIVLIALAGTSLEKQSLELRRTVSRQHYRLDALLERYATLRLEAQHLGAPPRLIDRLDQPAVDLGKPAQSLQSRKAAGARHQSSSVPKK
jgi:hypothetical protein